MSAKFKKYLRLSLTTCSILCGCAANPIDEPGTETRRVVVAPGMAQLKLIARPVAAGGERRGPGVELSVYDSGGALLQKINLHTSLNLDDKRRVISAYDVDGDGYKDVVINDGYGAGPLPATSLYRFDKNTGLFAEDKAFRGFSFPVPSEHRGCTYHELRISGMDGYVRMEMCEHPVQWTQRRVCAQSTPCFAEIGARIDAWNRKMRELEE